MIHIFDGAIGTMLQNAGLEPGAPRGITTHPYSPDIKSQKNAMTASGDSNEKIFPFVQCIVIFCAPHRQALSKRSKVMVNWPRPRVMPRRSVI